jgi:hypothetical protein
MYRSCSLHKLITSAIPLFCTVLVSALQNKELFMSHLVFYILKMCSESNVVVVVMEAGKESEGIKGRRGYLKCIVRNLKHGAR